MSVIIRGSTPSEISQMKRNKKISYTETVLFDEIQKQTNYVIIRQVHIGKYIVDGLLKNHKLIIEYDGHYHNTEQRRERDKERDAFLAKCGFLVIRYEWFQFINDNDEFKTALNCLIQLAIKDIDSLANFPTVERIPVRNELH